MMMKMDRVVWAVVLLLMYAALCAAVFLRAHRRQKLAQAAAAALLPASDAEQPLLVLHASQTGSAEEIAWATARALHLAGLPVRLLALGEATMADLQAASRALFITSTYGEGDAPDNGARFARDVMGGMASLAHLQFGVLALGDSTYAHFCGFGRALDAWLKERGAEALFERIEVDRGDEQALALWRQRLSHLAGTAEMLDWQASPFAAWQLLERRLLNPGSQGGPVFHLEFAPAQGAALPDWEAGDLVQLEIEGESPREYTISSLPAEGRVHLLVRQSRRADGSLGLASGLLTEGMPMQANASLRIRTHRNFRIGTNADRPLVLIGNGTGLAGLRAHLKAMAARGGRQRAWLLYGERQAAHDAHHADEIAAWQQSGLLARVDRCFSRDGGAQRYVQEALAEARETLVDWVEKGAAIYVCGSLQGMAGGVDAVLRDALGAEKIDALIAQARYQRDVY